MNGRSLVVEVCVASAEAARVAQQAGADRIELNAALELDGLTPSAGVLARVVRQLSIPVIAMARPCPGGFHYTADQWQTLVADAKWLMANGASGIAFGALDEAGKIDVGRCQQMRERVGFGQLVFHKAFDQVDDPVAALDQLIEAGIDRVMTSGLAPTALEGAPVIGQLIRQAAGRIEILPAGRISSQNVRQLLTATEASQIHGSFRNSGFSPDSANPADDLALEIQAVIGAAQRSAGSQNRH